MLRCFFFFAFFFFLSFVIIFFVFFFSSLLARFVCPTFCHGWTVLCLRLFDIYFGNYFLTLYESNTGKANKRKFVVNFFKGKHCAAHSVRPTQERDREQNMEQMTNRLSIHQGMREGKEEESRTRGMSFGRCIVCLCLWLTFQNGKKDIHSKFEEGKICFDI